MSFDARAFRRFESTEPAGGRRSRMFNARRGRGGPRGRTSALEGSRKPRGKKDMRSTPFVGALAIALLGWVTPEGAHAGETVTLGRGDAPIKEVTVYAGQALV